MKPKAQYITIHDNLEKIQEFINEIIIVPKHALSRWATITNQTPAAKIGYIGQHLTSLITGVPGTGSGARGDDLADGSEVKSCNKVDQADKCLDCGARVLRMETKCSACGSENIERKEDSKWLFSIRDEHELHQYMNLDRVVLLLMDYPKFDEGDFRDIRITAYELYPKDPRMQVFNELISNHYYNIYLPKINNNEKTNPMNLHPMSFQFYKCNPIKTFECIIENIDTDPRILIDFNSYIEPSRDRDDSLEPLPMPSSLLQKKEWDDLLSKIDYDTEILPNITQEFWAKKGINTLTLKQFKKLSLKDKALAFPYLDMRLKGLIPLRPIVSTRQKEHYQR